MKDILLPFGVSFRLSTVSIIKGHKVFQNFTVIDSSVASFCLAEGSNILDCTWVYWPEIFVSVTFTHVKYFS